MILYESVLKNATVHKITYIMCTHTVRKNDTVHKPTDALCTDTIRRSDSIHQRTRSKTQIFYVTIKCHFAFPINYNEMVNL